MFFFIILPYILGMGKTLSEAQAIAKEEQRETFEGQEKVLEKKYSHALVRQQNELDENLKKSLQALKYQYEQSTAALEMGRSAVRDKAQKLLRERLLKRKQFRVKQLIESTGRK